MPRIKRLYTFMLQTFLPVFAMTFFIVLFIVLMQFLWRYIDDLVGKGLDIDVIAELFFYAALTMVPMALPLAILLASLMTFGNLGEKFELTAMKASGISLMKVMRPLIVLIIFIAAGAFVFQNNVLPVAQTKMWTLLFSMRQKEPEKEIVEKVFNDKIPGYNIYVNEKDPQTGMLYDLMIYDMSSGNDNTRIIVADSGRIGMAPDGAHMAINLYGGEQFENLRSQTAGGTSRNLPFRRETFDKKDALIPFDDEFTRIDESAMRKQYVGKNMSELIATIDSVQSRVDSIGTLYAKEIKERGYFGITYYVDEGTRTDDNKRVQPLIVLNNPLDVDSLFNDNPNADRRRVISSALIKARQFKQEFEFKSYSMDDDRKSIRRHAIELHKKFTLSFACLIMFFIGAPLGAIIRKGGIGLPLVVSVLLFIFYYIIDNTGYKLARDGRVDVAVGMWLSSAVLLPLSIFLTYKAMHDANFFNFGALKDFFRKFRRKGRRELEYKEFTLEEVDPKVASQKLLDFGNNIKNIYNDWRNSFILFRPVKKRLLSGRLRKARKEMNDLILYLWDTRDRKVVQMLNDYPLLLTFKNLTETIEVNRKLREGFYNDGEDAESTENAESADSLHSEKSAEGADITDNTSI